MHETPSAVALAQKPFDREWFRLLPSEAVRHQYFTDQPGTPLPGICMSPEEANFSSPCVPSCTIP